MLFEKPIDPNAIPFGVSIFHQGLRPMILESEETLKGERGLWIVNLYGGLAQCVVAFVAEADLHSSHADNPDLYGDSFEAVARCVAASSADRQAILILEPNASHLSLVAFKQLNQSFTGGMFPDAKGSVN